MDEMFELLIRKHGYQSVLWSLINVIEHQKDYTQNADEHQRITKLTERLRHALRGNDVRE